MAHFDFTRPGGVWTGSPALLAAEMADLDSKTMRALNGDDGGTFLATECQGIDLTSGEILVYSGALIHLGSGGELQADSGSIIDLQAGSTVTGAGTYTVTSTGSIVVASGGELEVQSGGAVNVAAGATVTMAGRLVHSGSNGRTVKRVMTVSNASASIDVTDCDILFWETTDGNTYSVTLETAPLPSEGESITVRRRESGNGVGKVFDGGTGFELYHFIDDSSNEVSGCASFTFIGGRWRVTAGDRIQTEG